MSATAADRVSENQWLRYEDTRAGLTFPHPPDWVPQRGHAGLLVALVGPSGDSDFAPNLNVVRRANDVRMSLDDLARAAIGEVRRLLTDVALIDIEASVVAGSPARRLLFRYRQGIYGLTGEQWIWLTAEHIWTVTAGAPSERYHDLADVFAGLVEGLGVGE